VVGLGDAGRLGVKGVLTATESVVPLIATSRSVLMGVAVVSPTNRDATTPKTRGRKALIMTS
jgi:hypothetical protein